MYKKKITIFHLKIIIFTAVKYWCILHGHVFVMLDQRFLSENNEGSSDWSNKLADLKLRWKQMSSWLFHDDIAQCSYLTLSHFFFLVLFRCTTYDTSTTAPHQRNSTRLLIEISEQAEEKILVLSFSIL